MKEERQHLGNVGAGKSKKTLGTTGHVGRHTFVANRSPVDLYMDEFFSLQTWDGIILYP